MVNNIRLAFYCSLLINGTVISDKEREREETRDVINLGTNLFAGRT